MREDCIVVLITTGNKEEAEEIGSTLVEQSLAACANILPKVSSIFRWEGKICRESEVMLIVKTTAAKFDRVTEAVKELHSYDLPEIIALSIEKGSEDYLNWVRESVS